MRAALVFLALLLAGCQSPPPPAAGSADPAGSVSGSLAGGEGLDLDAEAPRLGAPRTLDLHLTEDGGLSPTLPDAGSLQAGMPAQSFFFGLAPLRFESEPFAQAALIEEGVAATLFLQSSAPLVSNGVFDFAVWFGSSVSTSLSVFATHDPVVAPGTLLEYDLVLPFDGRRPIVVPAGERLVAYVAADLSAASEQILLLLGGETPSRLGVTMRDYAVDPLEGVMEVELEGIRGQAGPGSAGTCDPAPGTTSQVHDVAVGAQAKSLRLAVSPEGTLLGGTDIDLLLSDGETVLALTTTPFADEAIFLAAEALDGLQGKTLQLGVSACQHGVVPYRVQVFQG